MHLLRLSAFAIQFSGPLLAEHALPMLNLKLSGDMYGTRSLCVALRMCCRRSPRRPEVEELTKGRREIVRRRKCSQRRVDSCRCGGIQCLPALSRFFLVSFERQETTYSRGRRARDFELSLKDDKKPSPSLLFHANIYFKSMKVLIEQRHRQFLTRSSKTERSSNTLIM